MLPKTQVMFYYAQFHFSFQFVNSQTLWLSIVNKLILTIKLISMKDFFLINLHSHARLRLRPTYEFFIIYWINSYEVLMYLSTNK